MTLHDPELVDFIRESNRIEGITREPTIDEIEASEGFLALTMVGVLDLDDLVDIYQPGAALRLKPDIVNSLETILLAANDGVLSPSKVNADFETLHPFTAGNGRAGRMLWAWMMQQGQDDDPDWLRRAIAAIRALSTG